MIDLGFFITQLERNKLTIHSLLTDTPAQEYEWRKNADKWSLLEIICHLVDEEKEDFRARLQHVLERPDTKPGAIDPVGWVISRQYQAQDFKEKLEEFAVERDRSIDWLKSLDNENWDQGYQSAEFGLVNGHFYINNWLAHDYLHIRQITRVRYDYLQSNSPVDIRYAGKWVAT